MNYFNSFAKLGLRIVSIIFVCAIGTSTVPAQPTKPIVNAGKSDVVTLTQSVEPSFHIEPIVHRFSGRRGQVIPFEYKIASTGKAMDVIIVATDLRQEESGVIMHNEGASASEYVKILSDVEFKLAPGEATVIRGEVTVPIAKTNFISFGLLVKDRGQLSQKTETNSGPNQTTAAIRFVTQYILRIDIETGVQDVTEMSKLTIESGNVRAVRGFPIATTYLVNPTDFALECFAKGTIATDASSRSTPFSLGLPSRRDLPGDERFLVRVMPQSRVRLEAPVDMLMFPGRQSFQVTVSNGRRTVVEQTFSQEVVAGDFPALDAKLAFLGSNVCVEPAQIEVGTLAGINRTCSLKFTNNSEAVQNYVLEAHDLNGQPIGPLRISETDVELKPGRTKSIRLTIASSKNDKSQFGYIRVRDTANNELTRSLPIAMLYTKYSEPQVELGDLQKVNDPSLTYYQLKVVNHGSEFVPISALLGVDDGKGHSYEMADGYGRWLAPGEERMLTFRPPTQLPRGEYQFKLTVQTRPEIEPTIKTLIIKVDDVVGSPASIGDAVVPDTTPTT